MTDEVENATSSGGARPPSNLRQFWARGLGLGVVVQGLGMALAFAAGAFAARLLGPAAFGEYAYALALAGAASVPAALGLPAVVTRFLAVYREDEAWPLARGLRRYADGVAGLTGLLLGAAVVAVGYLAWEGERRWLFLLAAPLVTLLAGINLRQKTLQGLEHPVAAQVPLQILKPGVFLVCAGAAWLAGAHIIRVPEGVMAAWLLSVASACLAGELLVRRNAPTELLEARPEYEGRRWIGVALPMLVADSVGVIHGKSATLVLGALRPASEVGHYEVALRTAAVLTVLLGASNWVLAPWFAQLHEEGSSERLQRIVTRTTRGVFGVTLLIFAVLTLWGRPLLETVFGPGYGAGYPALLVLGCAHLVNVGVGPVVNLLAMTGGQRALAVTVGGAALVNLVGCALLIPRLGMMGAALSFGVAMVVMNLVLSWVVKQRMGIRPTVC